MESTCGARVEITVAVFHGLIGELGMQNRQMSMALPSTWKGDSNVAKVVSYVLFDWLTRHMQFDCRADAVGMHQLFHWQQRPLRFKCVEVIHNRHYELEFEKEPIVFLMKKLTVRWLPLRDKESPLFFPTIISDKDVEQFSGFYKVVSEVAEDFQYLVSLEITRY